MKIIRTKLDAEEMMENFTAFASYDVQGDKYYFSFKDKERDGQWTLMFYKHEGRWSLHGAGAGYCDDGETILEDKQTVNFLYKNRKYVNSALKEMNKPAAV